MSTHAFIVSLQFEVRGEAAGMAAIGSALDAVVEKGQVLGLLEAQLPKCLDLRTPSKLLLKAVQCNVVGAMQKLLLSACQLMHLPVVTEPQTRRC